MFAPASHLLTVKKKKNRLSHRTWPKNDRVRRERQTPSNISSDRGGSIPLFNTLAGKSRLNFGLARASYRQEPHITPEYGKKDQHTDTGRAVVR
jgi:hypothetical protein